jgi:putative ABC transport system permease protein
VQSAAGFRLLSGDRQLAWQAFLQGRSVLVSEPLAEHWRLAPGDTVTLETDRAGSRKFNIAGVFRDYGSSRGVVLMERQLYDRLWADPEISSIGVLLGEHADPGQARSRVQQALADVEPPVLVRASREIREASLSVFDRTFAVTRVLRLLVVGVAFVGILSALMALQLERAREHAILRATGATPGQVVQLGMLEACLMGLVAGVLAMPVGWMVARLLIQVIQLRSFGWSMDAAWSSGVFGQTLLLAVFAALLGSLYPAWQMARSRPVEALREE